MNSTIRTERAELQQAPASSTTTAPKSPASSPKTLEKIVEAICMDARADSLKYVLRSDTGHDGE